MSPPETHITVLPISEACRADPAMLNQVFHDLAAVEGLESVYVGLQMEGGNYAYCFNNWATVEDFARFDSAPNHDDVLAPTMGIFVGLPKIYHITFQPDVHVPLSKPVTEIVFVTAMSAEAKQQLVDSLQGVCARMGGVMAFGAVIQREFKDVVVVICGWNSVEVSVFLMSRGHINLNSSDLRFDRNMKLL
ncbi:hypothetical protein HWV62_41132 [Athelia sp. TMB]|nr:hypothetical protein HWV62_41132 [Athelia sp. TMB]